MRTIFTKVFFLRLCKIKQENFKGLRIVPSLPLPPSPLPLSLSLLLSPSLGRELDLEVKKLQLEMRVKDVRGKEVKIH